MYILDNHTLLVQEVRSLAEEIKRHGKQSFGKDDRMDALWKYDHALLLYYSYPFLKSEAAAVHSDIAEVCLKVGDSLDAVSQDLPNSSLCLQLTWYKFSLQHTCKAFSILDPRSEILHKVNITNEQACCNNYNNNILYTIMYSDYCPLCV